MLDTSGNVVVKNFLVLAMLSCGSWNLSIKRCLNSFLTYIYLNRLTIRIIFNEWKYIYFFKDNGRNKRDLVLIAFFVWIIPMELDCMQAWVFARGIHLNTEASIVFQIPDMSNICLHGIKTNNHWNFLNNPQSKKNSVRCS